MTLTTEMGGHASSASAIPADLWAAIDRLSKDQRKSATLLPREQARWLVDTYYQVQKLRIHTGNQIKSVKKGKEEPHAVLQWLNENNRIIEDQLKGALGVFAKQYAVGAWTASICGIGPVISAGLLCHFDIRGHEYPSQFISFAGLNPEAVWEKGCKRPWNARLKTLTAFKLGESFIKQQNRPSDFYGKFFREERDKYEQLNLQGKYQEDARKKLELFNIGKNTHAYKWYAGRYKPLEIEEHAQKQREIIESFDVDNFDNEKEYDKAVEKAVKDLGPLPQHDPGEGVPMLPPAHLNARARRFAVKMFIFHLHEVMWHDYYGGNGAKYPDPYILAHGANHSQKIEPPNLDKCKGAPLSELYDESS